MLRAAVLLLGAMLLAAPAFAASETDRRDCSGESSPDRKIAACTHILEDAKSPSAPRVTAYRSRGIPYSKKGLYELATADFDEALKLDPRDALSMGSRGYAY